MISPNQCYTLALYDSNRAGTRAGRIPSAIKRTIDALVVRLFPITNGVRLRRRNNNSYRAYDDRSGKIFHLDLLSFA
jgi:hypothetical protein